MCVVAVSLEKWSAVVYNADTLLILLGKFDGIMFAFVNLGEMQSCNMKSECS